MNSDHESFLLPFFNEMNAVFPGKWCVLHSYETLPHYSESDVDMAFSHTDITRLEALILKIGNDSGFQMHQKLWYDLQYCLYYVLKHKDKDIFLALDFLIDNAGVGKYGFKTNLLTHQCTTVKNLFPIPNPEIAFCYKLVKRIVKKRSLSEDELYLKEHYKSSDPERISKFITQEFGPKGERLINEYLEEDGRPLNDSDIDYLNQIRRKKKKRNRNPIAHVYWQAKRTTNRIWYPGGAIISIPALPVDDLTQFVNILRRKVGILFRFVQLHDTFSIKRDFKALAGSTLVILPTQNYQATKAVKYNWKGDRYCGIGTEGNVQGQPIEQLADQYYKALLNATNQRVLRRLSNGK